jgi:hypothetical protein
VAIALTPAFDALLPRRAHRDETVAADYRA